MPRPVEWDALIAAENYDSLEEEILQLDRMKTRISFMGRLLHHYNEKEMYDRMDAWLRHYPEDEKQKPNVIYIIIVCKVNQGKVLEALEFLYSVEKLGELHRRHVIPILHRLIENDPNPDLLAHIVTKYKDLFISEDLQFMFGSDMSPEFLAEVFDGKFMEVHLEGVEPCKITPDNYCLKSQKKMEFFPFPYEDFIQTLDVDPKLVRVVERMKPYDVVIDGGNSLMCYTRGQVTGRSFHIIGSVIESCIAKGLRPLVVLHSRHKKNTKRTQDKYIPRGVQFLFTPGGEYDDKYIQLACWMHGGHKHFISNDMFRDCVFSVGSQSKKDAKTHFDRLCKDTGIVEWAQTFMVEFDENGKLSPFKEYSRCIQNGHIPVAGTTDSFYYVGAN